MTAEVTMDVVVEDNRWYGSVSEICGISQRAVTAAFEKAEFSGPCEICVLLTTASQLQELNRTHRDKDKPTNVLSFPAGDAPQIPGGPHMLGDIALSYETLEKEAAAANIAFTDHFLHLIIHAALHLIGYTHDIEENAVRMEALEIATLASLDISNPYEETPGATLQYGTREP